MIRVPAEEIAYYEGVRPKKPWMSTDMLRKMEERINQKTKRATYKKLNGLKSDTKSTRKGIKGGMG